MPFNGFSEFNRTIDAIGLYGEGAAGGEPLDPVPDEGSYLSPSANTDDVTPSRSLQSSSAHFPGLGARTLECRASRLALRLSALLQI